MSTMKACGRILSMKFRMFSRIRKTRRAGALKPR
jgi:hypothetical protein